jgi:DinB family protein
VQANRLIASELNAVNYELHALAGWMEPADWLRRSVPGTNLPAFIFWHIPRAIDSTVQMGIRGVPELIESEPWASKAWARPEVGVGYSVQEADDLAAEVVPAEVLEYADAVRAHVSHWLRATPDEDLEVPNQLMDHATGQPAYGRPAVREAIVPLVGQPVWLLLSITCFAHCWAHLEEIRLLTTVGRTGGG